MAMSSILLLDQSEPKKFKDGLAMSSILDQSEPRLFMNGLQRMLRMNFAHTHICTACHQMEAIMLSKTHGTITTTWYNHNHVPLLLLTDTILIIKTSARKYSPRTL